MKKVFFFIILILVTIIMIRCSVAKPSSGSDTEKAREVTTDVAKTPAPVNFSEQTTWILGYFTLDRLTREPYSTWYTKGYDDYSYNSDAINKLLGISGEGISIKIVMGTWCPDSRREVPRFMKVLDLWHFPLTGLTMIGVDDAKLSPVGEYDKLNIQRVPTFIIYKNNVEKGRIIENPTTSLEQDLVNILTRE